jgi:hypothetical protein
MKNKYLTRPWVIENKRGDDGQMYWNEIQTDTGYVIAEVKGSEEDIENDECDANATLFVAAPDLLEALESLRGIEAFIYDEKMKQFFQRKVYPAINKARGL